MKKVLSGASCTLTVVLLCAVLLVGEQLISVSSAQAASSPSSSSSACSVHLVHLDGQYPSTITCLQYGTAHPNISYDYCSDIYNLTAEIQTSSMGYWCFSGTGYTGLNPTLYRVTNVFGWNCSGGWVLEYNTHPGRKAYFNDNGVYSGPTPPYAGVTQIDVQYGYEC